MPGYEDLMGSPTDVKSMSYPGNTIDFNGQQLPAIPTANAMQLRSRRAKQKQARGPDEGTY